MKSNAKCWKLQLVGLVIGMSLLSACATGSFETVTGVCPPVVEYDPGFRTKAAAEIQALPQDAAVVEMLSDYAVMREQARGCQPAI